MIREQAKTKNDFKTISKPKNYRKQGPTSLQNRPKSCYLQPWVHPAAPIILQGGPEIPKWLSEVSLKCKNGSQNAKMARRIRDPRLKTFVGGLRHPPPLFKQARPPLKINTSRSVCVPPSVHPENLQSHPASKVPQPPASKL